MEQDRRDSLRIEVSFPDRALAKPILREISENRDLSVNILRGRMTENDAWFEVEIRGKPAKLQELLRLTEIWGVAVQRAEADVALAP